MTLPHQEDKEEEGEEREESHHTIEPAYVDLGNPLVGVEVDRQTEEETHGVDRNRSLGSVRSEALGNITIKKLE